MNTNNLWALSLNIFFRLTGYHLMCLMVSFSILAFFPDVAGGFVAQAFDLGIIIILPYLLMWKKGDTDNSSINNKVINYDAFLGFKAGLIAYAPYLLLCVALVFAKLGVLPESVSSWHKMIFAPFMPLNQSLMPTTLTFAEQGFVSVLVSAIVPFSVPVTIGLGYFMGVKRISVSETFLPKKPTDF